MSEDILLTAEGMAKLKAELAELKGTERLRIAEVIREAKSHGDLRENAMYSEAKLNQRRLESRISELERMMQFAKVVQDSDKVEGGAHLGSKVTLKDLEYGDKLVVNLVGEFEADPSEDRISITSPFGKALVNRLAGETVEFEAPAGSMRYEILAVD
jgi:transcription elongation factor GreA